MKAGKGGLDMEKNRFDGKRSSSLSRQEVWILSCPCVSLLTGDVKIGSIVQPELVLLGVRENLSIEDCMSNKQGCPPPYVCLFQQSVELSAVP